MGFALIFVALKPPTLEWGLGGQCCLALVYLMNASNGFVVTVLIWVAGPFGSARCRCRDAGDLLPLVGLFYMSCIPAAIAKRTMPEERWVRAGSLFVLWAALWFVLVGVL